MIRAVCSMLCAAVLWAGPAPARAQELEPFTATYSWMLRGMHAGESTLSLERRENGLWKYGSRSVARGLFRLIAPGDITQDSVFRIDADNILPEHYRGDDGTDSTKRDVNITFDWHARRVTGVYEDVKVDLAIEPGVHDDMSIQIALMYELLHGRTPTSFRLIDKNIIKDYQYTAEGMATLSTPMGERKAVIYRSRKVGARSSTVFWCDAALGYLPLKVERRDGADKPEWSMRIQSVKRE